MTVSNKYGVDTLKLLMKTTYLWLTLAIAAPMVYVGVAYVINGGKPLTEPGPDQPIIFGVLLGLSILQVAMAFLLRSQLMKRPTILSAETFAEDFASAFVRNFIIVSSLLEAIAIYGLVQFLAFGADLQVVLLFAIIGVIGFQLLRPREKFIRACLQEQEAHVAAGRFAPHPSRPS